MNTGYFVRSMRTEIVEYRVTRRRRRIAVDSGH